MVDYVEILTRAVAALDPNTSERRQALYEEARKTLAEKFRTNDPTLAATSLRAERAALEAAIRRVEAAVVRRALRSHPGPTYEVEEAPVEEYRDRPSLVDTRKRLVMLAGTVGALAILFVGATIYFYWPHVLAAARGILHSPVAKPADELVNGKSYIYMRQIVYYRTNYPVGTIVVDKSQTFLYVVRPSLAALRYTFGIGTKCTNMVGLFHVERKEEWPGLSTPSQQSANIADERMKSALGARALDLTKDYRIHGTSASPMPEQTEAKRCIGLVNNDVIDLYNRTPLGSRVVVLPKPQ